MKIGLAVFVLCAALIAYFGFYGLYGSHGMVRWVNLSDELALARAELRTIEGERMALERRVNQMKDASLDPDLLDEQARLTLGLSQQHELILPRPSKAASPTP
ncbi:MAG TPA: septum formation inhibitor [Alphaproteobacteria bacterium]|nr:septum formation inhibitor [Alphaproteobacteria bacterium]HAJ45403.1 septum formation inhibitor [Alphaproteobacteria bacterium]